MSILATATGIVACLLGLMRGFAGQSFMGRPLGGDFVQFYVIGKILNQFGAARIYDLDLAVRLQHSTLATMSGTQMLVFAHAPFVAVLFQPFALLPYAWAYVAWLVFSALLYAAAVALLFRALKLPRAQVGIGLLLAISSTAFLFETWIGGQISVVVFAIWAMFFYLRSRDFLFVAGLALSLASFKPTLIALPVALLIVGRRWRIVAGFCGGLAALGLASWGLVGSIGMRAWIETAIFNGRFAASGGAALRRIKNLDLNAFFHLILPGRPAVVLAVLASAALCFMLAAAWRKSGAYGWNEELLLWASTLTFTLVANTYVPIYDSLLVTTAAGLAVAGLSARAADVRADLSVWLAVLYLVPWITQSFAEFLHIQLLVPVLTGFGLWTLRHVAEEPSATKIPAQSMPLEDVPAFQ